MAILSAKFLTSIPLKGFSIGNYFSWQALIQMILLMFRFWWRRYSGMAAGIL